MLVTINSLGNSTCIMNKAVRSDDGTFTETAITKESLYASGIPENAVPAKAFFVDDSISKEEAWSKKYINESCLKSYEQDFDTYYFFISQTRIREYESPLIDIWCYNAEEKTSKRVYHQFGNDNDIPNIVDIHWTYDIVSKDTIIQAPVSKKTFGVIDKQPKPILILCQIQTLFTPHSSYNVELVDITSGKTIILKGEKFVSVFETDDTLLPATEIGLARRYILTTTSRNKDEMTETHNLPNEDLEQYEGNMPLPEDFIDKVSIVPYINVYTLEGEKVSTLKLPVDNIDVIR